MITIRNQNDDSVKPSSRKDRRDSHLHGYEWPGPNNGPLLRVTLPLLKGHGPLKRAIGPLTTSRHGLLRPPPWTFNYDVVVRSRCVSIENRQNMIGGWGDL